MIKHKIDVLFHEQKIKNSQYPKYLRITLDRTLTSKEHLSYTDKKLKTRNNFIQKLSNSVRGADTNTLRISTIVLTRSVTDYCSPVWLTKCSHKQNRYPIQYNILIPILCYPIQLCYENHYWNPPHLHRYNSLIREWTKCFSNTMLPIQNDINTGPNVRPKFLGNLEACSKINISQIQYKHRM